MSLMNSIGIRLVLFVFITVFIFASCSNNESSIKPEFKDITESVYASVTIEPDSLYQVYSIATGIIVDIKVKEGDTVSVNQIIAQIDNSSSKLNLDNARVALNLAEDNLKGLGSPLKSIEDRIQTARLNFTQDSINYLRQKRLWEQNIGTANQYDQSKLAFEVSRQNLSSLKKEYSRTRTELIATVNNARNNYEKAQLGKEDFTITSRFNGRVYEIFKEPGELISPQEPLATVGKSNSFKIKLLVDEVDIINVKVGQMVIVKLDAFSEEVFKAKISRILPQKNNRTQTFLVEAEFLSAPNNLYSGLSGEANVVVSEKKALVIPRRFLLENNTVKTSDGLQKVVTGVSNMEYIEIVSGLDTTSLIYLP